MFTIIDLFIKVFHFSDGVPLYVYIVYISLLLILIFPFSHFPILPHFLTTLLRFS